LKLSGRCGDFWVLPDRYPSKPKCPFGIDTRTNRTYATWLPISGKATFGIARDVQVGPGTLVAAGAVINPGVVIGKNVIVNTLACIEHDCTIENGVHVAPGARLAGHVRVGSGAWIGIGATIIDKITIGKHSIIGAGSVVIRNIPADVVVAGVPARRIRTAPSD
jgi:sugar O-acyltransferase (sialic acid O-acetyltransferase NeuD family)